MSFQFGASGGTPPYSFVLSSGALPQGFSLSSSGLLQGPATFTPGNYSFAVTAYDSTVEGPQSSTEDFTLQLVNQLTITTTSFPDAVVGVSYLATPQASGGFGSYTFSIVSGSLPAGLSLNSGNQIAGDCSAPVSSSFVLGVMDSAGDTASGSFTINCNPFPVITNASFPNGVVGVAYSQQLTTNAIYNPPGTAPILGPPPDYHRVSV